MHFYRFHVGDYLSHTHHLTPMEDLAYRKMLDYAYLHERGLEGDVAAIARAIGLRGQEKEVESVLSDFWFCTDGVWKNHRVEEELAMMADKQSKAVAAGKASGAARRTANGRSTDAERTLNGRRTIQDSETQDSETPVPEAHASRAALVGRPEDVPDDLWREWVAFRKAKRAPVTRLVLDTTRAKATAAGMSMREALTNWIANGQTGFYPTTGQRPAPGSKLGQPVAEHPRGMPIPFDSPLSPCHCPMCKAARERRGTAKARSDDGAVDGGKEIDRGTGEAPGPLHKEQKE